MLNAKLKLLSVALGTVILPVASLAAESASLAKVNARTKQLEVEVKELKRELRATQQANAVPHTIKGKDAVSAELNTAMIDVDNTTSPLIKYLGGTPIVVSPYLGERSQFDASDLIVNIPYANDDLRILQQWQKIEQQYSKYHLHSHPFIDISGKLEAQALGSRPYVGRKTSDVDLTAAELDVLARVNPWVAGFIAFKYDNSLATPPRSSNSRVFINRGFATIGNLNQVPVYFTIGQAYLPFGLYSSSMVNAPLTQVLGRTKARYIQLGYNQDSLGLYGAAYAFKGDTTTSGSSNRINQGGINAGYKFSVNKLAVDLGGGYIANLADSEGMQANGAGSGFTGFGGSTANETILHQVPGVNVRAKLTYAPFGLIAEYIAATKQFDATNMTFNGHGAKPSALNLEGSYSFHVLEKPTAISLGYQQSKQALALLMPEKRYVAALNTSIWRSTIASLEYSHNINYAVNDSATGQGLAIAGTGLGKSSDAVTAQFGIYF